MTKNFTCNGHCSNCGECCSDLLHLSDFEVHRIDIYLKTHAIKERKTTIDNGQPTVDLTCPFRNNVLKKCEIYEVRPRICRLYKCDIPQKEAIKMRDEINKGKKVRSMRELFFNNDENILALKQNFGVKVYKRNE